MRIKINKYKIYREKANYYNNNNNKKTEKTKRKKKQISLCKI